MAVEQKFQLASLQEIPPRRATAGTGLQSQNINRLTLSRGSKSLDQRFSRQQIIPDDLAGRRKETLRRKMEGDFLQPFILEPPVNHAEKVREMKPAGGGLVPDFAGGAVESLQTLW